MTSRLPGAAQVRTLAALRGVGHVAIEADGMTTPRIAPLALVAGLEGAGWVARVDGILKLTHAGENALADTEARTIYRASRTTEIQVTPRARGRSPIRGRGGVSAGKNVRCSYCYRAACAARDAGEAGVSPHPVVWFTNEPGAGARMDAEIAAGKHILRHQSGELPSPGKTVG